MRVMIRWLVALGAVMMVSQAVAQVAVSEVWRHPDTGDLYALPTFADSAGRAPAIHVSDDTGQSWIRLPGVPDGAGGELDIRTFAIIPDAGGNDVLFAGTEVNGVLRSDDGGTTWTPWNEAAIGIDQISVAERPGEASWVVASDGAVYVSLDDGANWTLVADIAAMTVTAITSSGGDMAWVGTDSGDLIELTAAGTAVTFLTGGTPFAGEISALARTAEGTLYMVVDEGDPDGSHLYRTDSADLMTFVQVLRNGESLHIRGLATVGNSVHLFEFLEDVIFAGIGEPLVYLVTDDRGQTYTDEGAPTIFANQIFAGSCDGCDPWVLVAHVQGLYLKSREGIGWNILAAVDEPFVAPPPPPPSTTSADLSVRMVSPAASTDRIVRSTRRYELAVTNNGPDDVSSVLVEIEFSTWADTGSVISPVSRWGESATIAGQECDRDSFSITEQFLLCRLDSLPAGESASIVLTQNLPDKTFQLRIDAEVSADFNNDPFGGNDWIAYQPAVDPDAPAGNPVGSPPIDGSGGGGSFGVLGLLGLLAVTARRTSMKKSSNDSSLAVMCMAVWARNTLGRIFVCS